MPCEGDKGMRHRAFSIGTEALYRIKVTLLILANIGWLLALVYMLGTF